MPTEATNRPGQGTRLLSFTLAFPMQLEDKRVVAWLRAISGSMGGSASWRTTPPALGFELRSDKSGLSYRIRVPKSSADFVVAELRTLIPGMHVTPANSQHTAPWTRAVEVGIKGSHLPLRVFSVADVATSLLASVQGLGRSEALLIQWVMAPAAPRRAPTSRATGHERSGDRQEREELQEQRKKLAEPNYHAVLRVAAQASSADKAEHLISRVRAAMLSTSSPGTRFTRRLVTSKGIARRIECALPACFYPIQLSATEAAALIAWPVGEPSVAGLPQTRSRHLPPTEAVARNGLIVAASNMPGARRNLAISIESSNKHLHVVGPTGTGKTVLLRNLAAQAMAHGSGVVVLESKGDLFRAALDVVPANRVDDVIVLDVTNSQFPVGFNILRDGSQRSVVDELVALFERLYRENRNVWTREMLFHGLDTLVRTPGCTFVDLPLLLAPMTPDEEAWRAEVVGAVSDRELKTFWRRYLGHPQATQLRMAQPVLDRVWQLNARPEIRNVIGQSKSSFTMREVVQQQKILLINLSGLGQATAGLAGTLFINALWGAVQAPGEHRQTHLLLDEFQDFLNLPVDPADMFAKARSFRLGIVAAHQNLGQLPADLQEAVLANAHSKVVFQTGADDARAFAREFGRRVDDQDFMNLGQYEVLAKLAGTEGMSQPVSGISRPPYKSTGVAEQVQALSRKKYGRRVEDVHAEIEARHRPKNSGPPNKRKPPNLGSIDWD